MSGSVKGARKTGGTYGQLVMPARARPAVARRPHVARAEQAGACHISSTRALVKIHNTSTSGRKGAPMQRLHTFCTLIHVRPQITSRSFCGLLLQDNTRTPYLSCAPPRPNIVCAA